MKLTAIGFILMLLIFSACTESQKKAIKDDEVNIVHPNETKVSDIAADSIMEKNGIVVYESKIGQLFNQANLELISPKKTILSKTDTTLIFRLDSFQLGVMTNDLKMAGIDNSTRGQSVHIIINNQPYQAAFDTSIAINLTKGENYVLGFLARSYHESVKHNEASFLKRFFVGPAKADTAAPDSPVPMLFYNSPFGSYSGSNTKKILLDFYLKNIKLSPNGYKVRATINGEKFILSKWAPYFIEGLTLGKNKVRLELLDSLNAPVVAPGLNKPGKFQDTGERIIILKQGPTVQ